MNRDPTENISPVLEQIIKTSLFVALVYENGMTILVIHLSNAKLRELLARYEALPQEKVLVGEDTIDSCTFPSFQDNSGCKFLSLCQVICRALCQIFLLTVIELPFLVDLKHSYHFLKEKNPKKSQPRVPTGERFRNPL